MTASEAGGYSKQEYALLSDMPFCVTIGPSWAFESMSKILALRLAVVSEIAGVSPISTKVIIGLI